MNRSRSESTIKGAAPFGSANGSSKPKAHISFLQPSKEEKNILLDSVRERLEKLREAQRKKDMEEKFKHDQKLLKELLLEDEIQTLISKKIREAALVEETQSLLSVQSQCSSRGVIRSVGHSCVLVTRGDAGAANHHPMASTMPAETARHGEDKASTFHSLHGAYTYPSSASRLHPGDDHDDASMITSRQLTPERAARTETGVGMDDNSDMNSDLNSIGSAGSLGSITRRPALIIIKKKDINGRKILETVRQKLPSPEKLEGDPQYPTAAFTASLILKQQRQQQKEEQAQEKLMQAHVQAQVQEQTQQGPRPGAPPAGTALSQNSATISSATGRDLTGSSTSSVKSTISSGKQIKLTPVVENTSSKSDTEGSGTVTVGGSGRWNLVRPMVQRGGGDVLQSEDSFSALDCGSSEDIVPSMYKPAPFLKARSSSGILNKGLLDAEAAAVVVPVPMRRNSVIGEVVHGLSVTHLRRAVSRRSIDRPAMRASQQFTLQSINLHLEELQGEDILSTRFGGWTPPPMSSSSKHTSSTNFY